MSKPDRPDDHDLVELDDDDFEEIIERNFGKMLLDVSNPSDNIRSGVRDDINEMLFNDEGKLTLYLPANETEADSMIMDLFRMSHGQGVSMIIKKSEGYIVLYRKKDNLQPLSSDFITYLRTLNK